MTGRPPNRVLQSISPEQLAKDVAEALEAHVGSMAFHVGKTLVDMGPSEIRSSVHALAHYAIHGGALDAPVEEYLVSMLPLWMRASDGASVATPEFDDIDKADPSTWVGQLALVMRAAVGRELLDHGYPVAPAELAVLGGVTSHHVRLLLRTGELDGIDDGSRWTIPAESARRWLILRGPATA